MSSSRPILHLNNVTPAEPKKMVQVLVRVKRDKPNINARELYTPKQVSAILKVSVARLRDLRWKKKPPHYIKLGNAPKAQVRYLGQDLLDYLSSVKVRDE